VNITLKPPASQSPATGHVRIPSGSRLLQVRRRRVGVAFVSFGVVMPPVLVEQVFPRLAVGAEERIPDVDPRWALLALGECLENHVGRLALPGMVPARRVADEVRIAITSRRPLAALQALRSARNYLGP
jgi:hypothetical protein